MSKRLSCQQQSKAAAKRRRQQQIYQDHLTLYPHDITFSLLGDKFKNVNSSSSSVLNGEASNSIDGNVINVSEDSRSNVDEIDERPQIIQEAETTEESQDVNQHRIDINNQAIEETDRISEANPMQETNNPEPESFFCTKQANQFIFPATFKQNITENDHLVSALGELVRYNLPYKYMLSHFQWTNSITYNVQLPTCKDQLWRALSKKDSNFVRHYYCSVCLSYLGNNIGEQKNKKKKSKQKETPSYKPCSSTVCISQKSKVCYFVQIKLYPQLAELFKIPHIMKLISYRSSRKKINPNAVEDLYDGIEYRKLTLPGKFLSNLNNLSFTFNTDGCQVSKSSKASAYPIYLEINELPPHARKRHMLLAGIYCDSEKPNMNTILSKCLSELDELYKNGIKWKNADNITVVSKFTLLLCSVDTIARNPILRITQFNGKNGCTFCYAEGVTNDNNALHRYYPSSEVANTRTHAEMRSDMMEAFQTNDKVRGILGVSCLVAYPDFDLAKGPIVESMHNVFLGVTKQHITLLIDIIEPRYHFLITERVKKIKPPSRISRAPRSIDDIANFKASEFRNWLIYYSLVCFKYLIDPKYLKHLALLAQAIYYLNQESVTPEEIDTAEMLITQYVKEYEQLFGIEKMTYNIHLLTHLPDTVRNWGPLWAHTAFPFESWNRRIMESIQSPKDRVLQAATRFCIMKFISNILYDDSISQETKNYLHSLFPSYNFNYNDGSRNFIGKGSASVCPEIHIPPQYQGLEVKSFNEAKINNISYRSSENNEETQFCNSFVYCANVGFGEIEKIIELEINNEKLNGIMVKKWKIKNTVLYTDYIKQVESTSDLIFVPSSEIIRPAIVISDNEDYKYIIKLPNVWESD